MTFDDERVLFYLRHRERIEAWAALRTVAAETVGTWLEELEPNVLALAKELGADVESRAFIGAEQAYPSFRLFRNSWLEAAEEPPVSVGVEWQRGKVTMGPGTTPYVGLKSLKETAVGATLRNSSRVKAVRQGRREAVNAWWVAWTYLPPQGGFPERRDEYRLELVEALRSAWKAYAPLVDEAMTNGPLA